MKKSVSLRSMSLLLATIILFTSCASTTLINSNPSGAKLYLNGEPFGETPYRYTDTKIVGSSTLITLEKEGYESFQTSLVRNEEADVGAIIGGFFVLVPFLWTMKYRPVHNYELTPIGDNQSTFQVEKRVNDGSKTERLRELKQLLDEKIITEKEFQDQKKRILEE